MRCAEAERLVDACVDGTLESGRAAELVRHADGCARCAERLRLARGVRAALLSAPALTAPAGFARRVMDEVYRQALQGIPRQPAPAGAEAGGSPAGSAAARAYRRLGLSFLLTAGVLAVSLLVPRVAYPTLLGGTGAEMARDSASVVRGVLTDAEGVVRGALGGKNDGGNMGRHAPGALGGNAR